MKQASRLLWQSARQLSRPSSRNLAPCCSQIRCATTYSTPSQRFRDSLKKAQKDNPVLLPILLIGSIASVSVLGLLLYDDYIRVSPNFQAYPKAVEQRLRVALHYTHVEPDPEAAEAQFTEALRVTEHLKMDPFSKEVMGIRIRLAEMLEKFGRVKSSIEVLNGIITSCEEKVAEIDQEKTDQADLRTALLRGIIQARVKAAALYESDYVQDMGKAKQTLSDAVGLLVKETQDPQTKGFSENNAAGLSLSEIAAMLSQMGDLYATSGEEANAVQVYMLTLQPLRASCNGTKSCKEAQILNNIASTMGLAMKKPGAKINGKPATKESLAAARKAILKWTDQAIATAKAVKPEDRDEICELSLMSAEMTKAELLLDDGKKLQAKEAFRAMIPCLKERGLEHLTQVAEDGMKRASV